MRRDWRGVLTAPFDIKPLADTTFGAVVRGPRLAGIGDADFADLYRTWLKHALLIFPGQHLSRREQIELAKRFGHLEFEIAPISNVRSDGTVRVEDEKTASSRFSKAIWAGTAIPPTCRFRRRARCSPPRSCQSPAARPALPTCAPPTM